MNINQLNCLLLVVCMIVGVTFGTSSSDSNEHNSAPPERQRKKGEWMACMMHCMSNNSEAYDQWTYDCGSYEKSVFCERTCEEIERLPAAEKGGKLRAIKKALRKTKSKIIGA